MLLFLFLFFLIPYIHTSCFERNTRERAKKKPQSSSVQQPVNQPPYRGFCATSVTCADSFQGVSFVDSTVCGAQLASMQCCVPPSEPVFCAAPHVNSKCLNSNEHRKADCVGGTFVQFVPSHLPPSPLLPFPIPLCLPPFCVSFSADVNILKIKIEAFVPVAQMMMFNVVFFHKMLGEIIKS